MFIYKIGSVAVSHYVSFYKKNIYVLGIQTEVNNNITPRNI